MILFDYFPHLAAQTLLVVITISLVRPPLIGRPLLLIVGLAYLTVPIALLRTGIAGALYVQDLLLPLALLIILLTRPRFLFEGLERVEAWALGLTIIGFPLLTTAVLVCLGKYNLSEGDALYFYRHTIYLMTFSACLGASLEPKAAEGFVRVIVALTVSLCCLALVQYSGLWDLDFFTQIKSARGHTGQSPHTLLMGRGFVGLFRGSVGQWFAAGAVLSLALIALGRGNTFLGIAGFALSTLAVLLSFSRTGMIGYVAGAAAFLLSVSGRRIAVGIFLMGTLLQGLVVYALADPVAIEPIRSRYGTIGGLWQPEQDPAFWARLSAWRASVEFFMEEPTRLLSGLGAVSDEQIFQLTGIYGAHNEFLQVIYKGGVFSLASLVLFIGLAFTSFLRAWLRSQGGARIVAGAALAVLAGNLTMAIPGSVFIGNYATHTVAVYNYVLIGTLLGALRRTAESGNRGGVRSGPKEYYRRQT